MKRSKMNHDFWYKFPKYKPENGFKYLIIKENYYDIDIEIGIYDAEEYNDMYSGGWSWCNQVILYFKWIPNHDDKEFDDIIKHQQIKWKYYYAEYLEKNNK